MTERTQKANCENCGHLKDDHIPSNPLAVITKGARLVIKCRGHEDCYCQKHWPVQINPKPPSSPQGTCLECGGSGEIAQSKGMGGLSECVIDGGGPAMDTCPKCFGTGLPKTGRPKRPSVVHESSREKWIEAFDALESYCDSLEKLVKLHRQLCKVLLCRDANGKYDGDAFNHINGQIESLEHQLKQSSQQGSEG